MSTVWIQRNHFYTPERESEGEREGEREKERKREREIESLSPKETVYKFSK